MTKDQLLELLGKFPDVPGDTPVRFSVGVQLTGELYPEIWVVEDDDGLVIWLCDAGKDDDYGESGAFFRTVGSAPGVKTLRRGVLGLGFG